MPEFAATAHPGAKEQSHIILWDEFSASKLQSPGRLSEVAVLEVPAQQLLSLTPRMFALILKAEHIETFAASGAATANVNLRAAGHKPIATAMSAPALPSKDHPDIGAWISDDGNTWTEANVTAWDPVTGIVTVAKVATTTRIAVYFVPGDGEIAISAKRPTGSDDVKATLFRTTARALFQTNQNDERTAPRFSEHKRLPPFWRLSIEMSTVSKIAWNARAEHLLELPSTKLSVRVQNRQMLDQAAERALRGGLQ